MGKLVRQCDMEVMKMAMLKHEETFRQQVHELHRLYRIQTQLMGADLSTRRQPRRRGNKQPRRALNLQLPADEYIVGAADEYIVGAVNDEDDDRCGTGAELELTLAVGGRRTGTARKNNVSKRGEAKHNGPGGLSSPFASDYSGGTSLSSSPPSSAEYSEGTVGVALHGYPGVPPCQRAMTFDLGVAEAMKQHQSPWQLVQCQYLSLRMT
ncbi:uncharacterized protein LOC123395890 [Hordeum vulgare subsp. vulgare]|uniref:Uncharacterized protein n=1 Tax=Hordeum vulgare subsp. vulgare TaxID=112509 RepID=M0XPU8_HORVV|nr:uncharacterized protein LOC123395890 [Hordeum vulgare subsp. vulgare]XP_044946853.1 uncharacterized protein LOC123395890 [Hordeum vulgare subsp. vulgare]